MRNWYRVALRAGVLSALCFVPGIVFAQSPTRPVGRTLDLRSVQPTDRINRPVDDAVRVARPGNRPALARPEFDFGAVPDDTRLERAMLVLQADAAQQQALDELTAAQQDINSPYYHQWLTPADFGRTFGISASDLNQVVSWLERQGFAVEPVEESRRQIVFSGTAAQVRAAFHTEIHEYRVNGAVHHANASDPEIPEALADVVGGVVSLHDFHSQPMHARIEPAASPEYSSGGTHYLAPADFVTIYDLNPLYGNSADGTGQSVAIVARTNLKLADVQAFRKNFGLPAKDPIIVLNGPDPGVVSTDEQGEAELDTEWSGAVAKNASIQVVVSASTQTTDGVDLSAQYIVNHNLAPVVSLSFGSCEAAMGTAENQFWNGLWQQAAAQGMSVFVASGDNGAAGCDDPSSSTAVDGRAVNGLCSSPYSTCVGGTEFNDVSNPAQYWSSTNTSAWESAQTYIPENAWNESGTTAGGSGLWSTGGGASIVYAKPSWQAGPGVPADGHRDVPDVSLSSAGHDGYLIYLNGQYYSAAGTSASTPSFAGLLALVVQRFGARQGNANPVLYTLASNQSNGGPAVFHDITSGNNSVPGLTGYTAGAGYDLATGLGSVDANLLVNAWTNGGTATPALLLNVPAAASMTVGSSTTVTVASSAMGGFNAAVSLSIAPLPSGLSASFAPAKLNAPGSGSSVLTLTAGAQAAANTYTLTVTANGGGLTKTAPLAVTIAPKCAYSISPTSASAAAGAGNGSVLVTAATGCSWTAASNTNWLTLTSGSSGSGNGAVAYAVAANSATAARTGALTIAGLTFTVTQAAAAPFSVNPSAATFGPAGGASSVNVIALSASASWTAKSNASWITITAGGSGTGSKTVTYSVAANTATAARTGTMTIAGLTFTVTQTGAAPAAFALSPGSATFGSAGGSSSVAVTAPSASSSWTATSNASWITITAGSSGTGSKTVTYSVAANTTSATRTGTMTIAGLTFTVTQAGMSCSYTIQVGAIQSAASGFTGSVSVLTNPGCAWTAASSASWIAITSGTSGSGNGTVKFTIAAYTGSGTRTGTLTVAGVALTITEGVRGSISLSQPVAKRARN